MMIGTMFDKRDLRDMQERNITPETVLSQLEILKKGIPFVDLDRACTAGDGIKIIEENQHERLKILCRQAVNNGRAAKFVPASGAATRMFQSLLSAQKLFNGNARELLLPTAENNNSDLKEFLQFFTHLEKFAFYDELKSKLAEQNLDIRDLLEKKSYPKIVKTLLDPEGLNYGNLSKGLITFHKYPQGNRSAFEEHLVEAAAYVKDANGAARVCFTISKTPENETSAKAHIENVRRRYEENGLRFDIRWMYQKPSTDTIAMDLNGELFRESSGKLHFRPGGHGALLENLNDLKGDIIFIKNVDNVVPDRLKAPTYHYKQVLGGYLVDIQNKIFRYLETLSRRNIGNKSISEIFAFVKRELNLDVPARVETAARDIQIKFLFSFLNRPMRVCGMVKNAGEPGGGPFWVRGEDGWQSLQLVESSQINKNNDNQRRILESSTHFSPVDIVCGVRDFRGQPFDLRQFRDAASCFISRKSWEGRELTALEHPGLWNGGMAFWNTVFVEVPLITFNPVKTVFDLLRKEHQPGGELK